MTVEEHRRQAPGRLGFAFITVSDTRTPETDRSGQLLRELAERTGHRVAGSAIVQDDVPAIQEALRGALDQEGVDVVVLTGGTGLSPRDVTLDAVSPLLERQIEGFGELFRFLSYQDIGPAAMLSRALAGACRERAVFALPGSPGAVKLAMEKLVLPEAGHLVAQIRKGGR